MDSKIKYKDEYFELNDDFLDVGYMAENINVVDLKGDSFEIKRSHADRSMSILFSFPFSQDIFLNEILKIDEFLSYVKVPLNAFLIFDADYEEPTVLKNRLKKLKIVLDKEKEFSQMYGTMFMSGSLKGKLTKSMFLISKDGAVFYLDIPDDLEKFIDLERLAIELNKAQASYTGVGCHG